MRGYTETFRTDALIARGEARKAIQERDEARAALAARETELERLLTLAYREGWAHRDLGREPSSAATVTAILAGDIQ